MKCLIEFTTGSKLSDYIVKLSETSSEIEKVSHEATEQTPALEDYRYTGANPNNYVYFGCEEECTEENLYRVIGVLPTQSTVDGEYENRVKLIKAKKYTEQTYYIGDVLYTASNILNTTYLDSLGEYQKYIENSKWYWGAIYWNNDSSFTPNQYYNGERNTSVGYGLSAYYNIAKIALLYPSDYAYSISKSYWEGSVDSNAASYLTNAWLNNKITEWTITRDSAFNSYYHAMNKTINSSGNISYQDANNNTNSIRPAFYLKADVLLKNGDGTMENPYRVMI